VANPNPNPAGRWKKGQSGNLLGGRKHDPDIKRLKNLTKSELIEVGNLIVKGTVQELREKAADPSASVIQTMISAVAVKIMKQGDMQSLNVLLDRLIGKVKDEIHHSGDLPGQVIVHLPDNGRSVNKDRKKK